MSNYIMFDAEAVKENMKACIIESEIVIDSITLTVNSQEYEEPLIVFINGEDLARLIEITSFMALNLVNAKISNERKN